MKKEAFQREYGMKKGSTKVLWKLLSTPSGMAEWFADKVDRKDDLFIFTWRKSSEQALQIENVPEERVRYRWVNEPEDTFFEFKIVNSELTGDITLIVTDFATPEDEEDSINLWNSEIEKLIRRIGL